MKNCIQCGSELPDEAVFCSECGTQQTKVGGKTDQKADTKLIQVDDQVSVAIPAPIPVPQPKGADNQTRKMKTGKTDAEKLLDEAPSNGAIKTYTPSDVRVKEDPKAPNTVIEVETIKPINKEKGQDKEKKTEKKKNEKNKSKNNGESKAISLTKNTMPQGSELLLFLALLSASVLPGIL